MTPCGVEWTPPRTYLINIHLLKCRLQDFEVLNVLVLEVCTKFYALHRHGSRKQHIHVLAVGGARAQLLDLVELRPEAVVDPREHVMPRQVVCGHVRRVHVDGHLWEKNGEKKTKAISFSAI